MNLRCILRKKSNNICGDYVQDSIVLHERTVLLKDLKLAGYR